MQSILFQDRNPVYAPNSHEQFASPAGQQRREKLEAAVRSSNYEVRLAAPHELDKVYALRYEVFLSDCTSTDSAGSDCDQYDEHADHLVVTAGEQIVATYRVMPVDRVLQAGLLPYSSNEFEISALLESFCPTSAVELGRSCVHPNHRNGALPKLLWSALAKYMMNNGRTEAFGCVSVFNATHGEAASLVDLFKLQKVWSDSLQCPPLMGVDSEYSSIATNQLKALVPPLLRSYLLLGARLYGGPSYDPIFKSHDFLIHFSTKTMTERCRKSFFSVS